MDNALEEELPRLAQALAHAKREEEIAKVLRIKAEQAIINEVGLKPIEGSRTIHIPGWSITTTNKVTRTLDPNEIEEVLELLPDDQVAVFLKPTIFIPGLRELEKTEPEAARILDRAMTTKPAKPSVTLKKIED